MKVYIVSAFSAEPCDDSSWVHKAFFKKEDAEEYIEKCGHTTFDENMDDYDYGWMVSSFVTEIDVE